MQALLACFDILCMMELACMLARVCFGMCCVFGISVWFLETATSKPLEYPLYVTPMQNNMRRNMRKKPASWIKPGDAHPAKTHRPVPTKCTCKH